MIDIRAANNAGRRSRMVGVLRTVVGECLSSARDDSCDPQHRQRNARRATLVLCRAPPALYRPPLRRTRPSFMRVAPRHLPPAVRVAPAFECAVVIGQRAEAHPGLVYRIAVEAQREFLNVAVGKARSKRTRLSVSRSLSEASKQTVLPKERSVGVGHAFIYTRTVLAASVAARFASLLNVSSYAALVFASQVSNKCF